jgi:hypothetical protein
MTKPKSLRTLRKAAEKEINRTLDAYTNELMAALEEHHGFKYSKAARAEIMAADKKPAKKKRTR